MSKRESEPSNEQPSKRRKTVAEPTTPALAFGGKVIYVATKGAVQDAVSLLLNALEFRNWSIGQEQDGAPSDQAAPTESGQQAAVGLDIEWRATFERGVPQRPAATLQLSAQDVVVVFHLSNLGTVPPVLQDLLGRSDVLKVGVGVEGDVRKIERDFGGLASRADELLSNGGLSAADEFCKKQGLFRVRGVVDLNDLARYAVDLGRPRSSLSAMCEELLGAHVPKTESIRMGNWETYPLTDAQLQYAVLDAWASLRCFQTMLERSPAALSNLRVGIVPTASANPPSTARSHEHIPVSATPKLLPATKHQVFELFNNGHEISAIAEVRGIKPGTVLGYLTDAISAGYAYDWARFAVPMEDEVAITAALTATPGEGLKTIKSALPERIDYSAIKLVQAHLARKGPTCTEAAGGDTFADPAKGPDETRTTSKGVVEAPP
eukprot:TRINITY_DN42901_c0_g1_i1.p1 TRINITY_DN42901_c0_g1~~TRINITY_DN42901_c0_g1_i1.p1  ORF type:complete len:436 (-),score=69.82 TRINITY_DN42901_c0_g1_i1:178-1485(-)